jgi:hypothetical protein
MKVSELTGSALDYLVAKAEGYVMERQSDMQMIKGEHRILVGPQEYELMRYQYSPSTDWAQGGPIIERERMQIGHPAANNWHASLPETWGCSGPTLLVAAMRAYAASKYGDEVPDEVPA